MKHIKKFNESIQDTNISKLNIIIEKDSVPITNNPLILEKIIGYQMEAYKNNEKNLGKELTNELTNLFGKPNKSLRLEFLTKLWILKYEDLIFNVYTAPKKGTTIEICDYTYDEIRMGKRENDIIEFLEELYSLINDISLEELNLRRAAKKYNL